MTIETERLLLIPLSTHQLKLWLEDIPSLEKELHCRYRAEPMEGRMPVIVKNQLESAEKDSVHFLFYTFWFLKRKADGFVVGSADFKSAPDEQGAVEIGYGLGEGFEHNGYMTEAVRAMCRWALTRENVSQVIAETWLDNLPSQNVLRRCGFSPFKQCSSIWWRLPA